jgi:hypothetical protein
MVLRTNASGTGRVGYVALLHAGAPVAVESGGRGRLYSAWLRGRIDARREL